MIRIPIIVIRVFALAGALFLFIDCAGRIKPWKFQDIYSLDVRVLDTKEWSAKVKRDMKDLDRIMTKELKYYIDKDEINLKTKQSIKKFHQEEERFYFYLLEEVV